MKSDESGGGHRMPVLELRGRARVVPDAGAGLAQVLASGLPSTRQLLDSFGPLALSVAAAHRHGRVVGCAYPSRTRLAPDGRLETAITAPPPGTELDQDVQGLGAILYALMTGYWPLPARDADLGGLPRAPRDDSGALVAPTGVRHGVAPELSALAMAALGAGVGNSHARVRTASAIGRVVGDLRAEWSSEVLPPRNHAEVGRRDLWVANAGGPSPSRDQATTRKLSLGMAGLLGGTLIVLCFLGYEMASMLGIGPSSAPRVVVGANIPAAPVSSGIGPAAVIGPEVPQAAGSSTALPPAVVAPALVPPVSAAPVGRAGPAGPVPSTRQYQHARSGKDKKAKKRRSSSDDD